MVPAELQALHDNLMAAQFPEDVFGGQSSKEEVAKIFRQLVKLAHPDRYNGNTEASLLAQKTFQRLGELHDLAKSAFNEGTYGQKKGGKKEETFDFVIKTRRGEYHLREVVADGDLSTVYAGDFLRDGVTVEIVAKITTEVEDNDLAQNEVRTIKTLREAVDDSYDFGKHLPVLLSQFKTTDGPIGTIWERMEGCDLFQVREKYPTGVPQEHAVWMLNRILLVLGFVHQQGVLHGNIDPSHIMIRPRDHNGWLIDWSYAIEKPKSSGQGFRVWNEAYSAPEVQHKGTPLPSSDLYSLGKVMIFCLGGNPETGEMPDRVDERLQRFIHYFCYEDQRTRTQDAWEARESLTHLRRNIFGPDRFREFRM